MNWSNQQPLLIKKKLTNEKLSNHAKKMKKSFFNKKTDSSEPVFLYVIVVILNRFSLSCHRYISQCLCPYGVQEFAYLLCHRYKEYPCQ